MIASQRASILFVIGTLQVGGAELHLASLAVELAARGWQVSIYSMAGDGPLRDMLVARNVEIILPPVHRDGRRVALPIRAGRLLRVLLHLFRVMRRSRPAIVHFFLPMSYVVGAPLAILAGRPLRVMSRRSLNLYQSNHPGVAIVERQLHRFMAAVLGNSRQVVSDLRSEGIPDERIGLIYNGLNPSRAEPDVTRDDLRAQLGIPDAALVITVLANLIPYKGHSDLVLALGEISNKMPVDWQLLVVGRDDGIGESIQALAEEKQIASHLRFLGARTDVANLLSASDIGVLPSHEEGFSNAIIEMMAAGLPVVATDVGGNAEAVVDGETGLIVPPHSPGILGQAIHQLATDRPMRVRFGQAGRERVSAHFSLDASVSNYVALYLGLLDGKMPGDISAVQPKGA